MTTLKASPKLSQKQQIMLAEMEKAMQTDAPNE